jgi:hypothetical protein
VRRTRTNLHHASRQFFLVLSGERPESGYRVMLEFFLENEGR